MSYTHVAFIFTCLLLCTISGCEGDSRTDIPSPILAEREGSLVNCTATEIESVVLGYDETISLVSYGGHLLEPGTANALYAMQQQAMMDGVNLHLLTGFIAHETLIELYDCGPNGNCDCNFCNDVPYPGYSKHQAGTSIDLQMDLPGVQSWLENHALDFGFVQEDPGHPFHWVHDGFATFPGPCNGSSDAPAIAIVPHSSQGFWTLNEDGLITSYGESQYFGQPEVPEFPERWVSMSGTANNKGYWVVSNQGKVKGFGDAESLVENHLITFDSGPVIGLVGSPSGLGYWVATEDGSVTAYGETPELQKTVVTSSGSPVTAMVEVPNGDGFWLVTSVGSLVMYNAAFYGELNLNGDKALSLASTTSGQGYWILGESGTIYPIGDADNVGSVVGLTDSPPTAILGYNSGEQGLWLLEESGVVTALEGAPSLPVSAVDYTLNDVSPTPLKLMYSKFSDRSEPKELDGAAVSEDIYVFIAPVGEVSRARFAANTDPVTGPILGEDKTWPFDLAGGTLVEANALDTYQLPSGNNTIFAHIERLHGLESSQIGASFEVMNPVCGDGKVEGIEECDSGPCCEPEKCKLRPASYECRGTQGTCDIPEFCNGLSPLCPNDDFLPANVICRVKGTECDIEEVCTGNEPDCPSNKVLPEGTFCGENGTCELGFCVTPEPEFEDVIQSDAIEAGNEDSMESNEDAGLVADGESHADIEGENKDDGNASEEADAGTDMGTDVSSEDASEISTENNSDGLQNSSDETSSPETVSHSPSGPENTPGSGSIAQPNGGEDVDTILDKSDILQPDESIDNATLESKGAGKGCQHGGAPFPIMTLLFMAALVRPCNKKDRSLF